MSQNGGFLGPQSMWLGLGVFALLLFGWKASAPAPDTNQPPVALRTIVDGAGARSVQLNRSDCLRLEDRVWVTLEDGVECIAFVASSKAEGTENAVIYFSGDVPEEQYPAETQDSARANYLRRAETWSSRLGVPVVIIGRPGLMGSSGFHLLGGRRDESVVIDRALDAVKERLSLRRVSLAGQSGGARIIAQLMVVGRRDIHCAAKGSGAYDIPRLRGGGTSSTNIFGDPGRRYLVPMRQVENVPRSSDRRTYVIGDRRDTVTPFNEQQAWADKLASLGHHVQLIESVAQGPDYHGMSEKALTAAAMCALGKPDPEIRTAVGK
jgi:hypothetical protein